LTAVGPWPDRTGILAGEAGRAPVEAGASMPVAILDWPGPGWALGMLWLLK
jgi:hypothetical protein